MKRAECYIKEFVKLQIKGLIKKCRKSWGCTGCPTTN